MSFSTFNKIPQFLQYHFIYQKSFFYALRSPLLNDRTKHTFKLLEYIWTKQTFNVSKNKKDKYANKFTTSKLIIENKNMSINNVDKTKMTEILMPLYLQCWRPSHLIEFVVDWNLFVTTNETNTTLRWKMNPCHVKMTNKTMPH